jgi:cell division protein FtsL
MSRPVAARRAPQHTARPAGRTLRPVPPPRRSSGPSRRPAAATAGSGLLLGAAGLARTLPDSRALDRLIRGRTWVAVIAVALIGIVAMQVHMLGLNAGIGRSVEKATELEQENTSLRMEVSRLSSGDRIAAEAQRLGLVMPNAGEVRYTGLHATDAARAARTMRAPDPDLAAQAEAAVQAGLGTGASALAPESAEKAPGDAPTPVTAAPQAAQPQAQTPVAQTSPAQTAPAQTATQTQTQTQTPAPVAPAQTAQPQTQAPATQSPTQQAAPVQGQGQVSATPAGGAVATPGG